MAFSGPDPKDFCKPFTRRAHHLQRILGYRRPAVAERIRLQTPSAAVCCGIFNAHTPRVSAHSSFILTP
jgi:hypothetical protein